MITFTDWLRTHGCTEHELWLLQNCLGAVLGFDHTIAKEAAKSWHDARQPISRHQENGLDPQRQAELLEAADNMARGGVVMSRPLRVELSRALRTHMDGRSKLNQRAIVEEAFDRLNSMLTHIPLAEEEAVLSTYPV